MVVIMPCASDKSPCAGAMKQAGDKLVKFVAHPEEMPDDKKIPHYVYARPYDIIPESGNSWRDVLCEYNKTYKSTGSNPWRLLPAEKLYRPRAYPNVYRRLVGKYGAKQVYILSAGWGLIDAEFLTPDYDITFYKKAPKWKRRYRQDPFDDLCQLRFDTTGPLVFFGLKDYMQLFGELTRSIECEKIVWYYNDTVQNSSRTPPHKPDVDFRPFDTTSRHKRTWHYECATDLIDGTIKI